MSLAAILEQFPISDGAYWISEPRAFQHPEDGYDEQYGFGEAQVSALRHEGTTLAGFLEEYGLRDCAPALEIGCGTGRLSIPLALSGRITELLLTDPSPAFCSITARKLSCLSPAPAGVSLAILSGDGLDRLPPQSFSLVIMRSVLHHITDIPAFFQAVARILIPGGLMICEEPCHDGYLLMGAMTQMIPDLLKGRGITLSAGQADTIRLFVDSMKFYARRDIDKSLAEDKHLFRPDELMSLSNVHGMELHFFPNRTFDNIGTRATPLPANYFESFYFSYLKYCMSWDEDLLSIFSEHVRPYFEYFSCLAGNNALPYLYGTFLCRKRE